MAQKKQAGIPYVSVVLPTYNQAQFLPDALDSILRQTWKDYELIVVNDGSTDETPDILNNYQARYGFTLIHQENQKLPRALNTGFRRAKGHYLTWTSSDNMMGATMLTTLVATLDHHPAIGMVYADWDVIDKEGKTLGTVNTFDYDRHLLMRINYINACFMYRRICQEAVGLYDPDYIYAEDWEYWWRVSTQFKLMRVPKALYKYRVHGASLTETDVLTQHGGRSKGYRRLSKKFRAHTLSWYYSKLKWRWLRLRLGHNPALRLQPRVKS